ncbi:MAG: M14 family metallopeptidase [Gammaproteobacteria bacterium]
MTLKKSCLFICFLLASVFCRAAQSGPVSELIPPGEAARYSRISTSAEMSAFWDEFVARTPLAHKETIGRSEQGRAIEALILSTGANKHPENTRITSLLIGSQHGFSEPAGGEALMVIAKQLVDGPLRPLLDAMDVVMIANANPDGRDLHRRANSNAININTDFVLLSQSESRALKDALARFQPDAVLDSHESAVYKRKSLAQEGYMTDFNAQFESATNPSVPEVISSYAYGELLPEMIRRVSAGGLPAHRYIGEITSTRQVITNGGLTLRNYRNTAGLGGRFSFLVETKLDPRVDSFPTFRNIAVRIERQILCLTTFLQVIFERREEILRRVKLGQEAAHREPVTLYSAYVADSSHPFTSIPMRRIDDRKLEEIKFRDHRRTMSADTIPLPEKVFVTREAAAIQEILSRHGVEAQTLTKPLQIAVTAMRFQPFSDLKQRVKVLGREPRILQAEVGTLAIDLAQPNGRLVPLLLDPRSTSSIFRYPHFAEMIRSDEEFFIYSAERQDSRKKPR